VEINAKEFGSKFQSKREVSFISFTYAIFYISDLPIPGFRSKVLPSTVWDSLNLSFTWFNRQ